MAKRKKSDEVQAAGYPETDPAIAADAPEAPAPEVDASEEPAAEPDSPEVAALKARIAELEALAGATAPAAAVRSEPGFFEVELAGAPTHVVAAVDEANAWVEYKRVLGVLASENEPSVRRVGRELYLAQEARLAKAYHPKTMPHAHKERWVALGVATEAEMFAPA